MKLDKITIVQPSHPTAMPFWRLTAPDNAIWETTALHSPNRTKKEIIEKI